MLDEETYYTVEEVAARFRVSKMTVYRAVKRGDLDAVHFPATIRISETAITAFLNRK